MKTFLNCEVISQKHRRLVSELIEIYSGLGWHANEPKRLQRLAEIERTLRVRNVAELVQGMLKITNDLLKQITKVAHIVDQANPLYVNESTMQQELSCIRSWLSLQHSLQDTLRNLCASMTSAEACSTHVCEWSASNRTGFGKSVDMLKALWQGKKCRLRRDILLSENGIERIEVSLVAIVSKRLEAANAHLLRGEKVEPALRKLLLHTQPKATSMTLLKQLTIKLKSMFEKSAKITAQYIKSTLNCARSLLKHLYRLSYEMFSPTSLYGKIMQKVLVLVSASLSVFVAGKLCVWMGIEMCKGTEYEHGIQAETETLKSIAARKNSIKLQRQKQESAANGWAAMAWGVLGTAVMTGATVWAGPAGAVGVKGLPILAGSVIGHLYGSSVDTLAGQTAERTIATTSVELEADYSQLGIIRLMNVVCKLPCAAQVCEIIGPLLNIVIKTLTYGVTNSGNLVNSILLSARHLIESIPRITTQMGTLAAIGGAFGSATVAYDMLKGKIPKQFDTALRTAAEEIKEQPSNQE